MDIGSVKSRLLFQNLNSSSNHNFSEFFEAVSRFFSGVRLISHHFQKAVPAIEQACTGQEPAEDSNILKDAGYNIYLLGFGFICCLFETVFTHISWHNNPDCWISVPSSYFSYQL